VGGESKGIEAYLLAPGHYMLLYFTLYNSKCDRPGVDKCISVN